MDAPSLFAVTPAPVNLVSPSEAPSGAAPSAMRGADFANLLGHLMNPQGRQDLAAAGLQALPIGPQIEVITGAEPLPDAASLAAFAKGQGLDEAMVQALFGGALADGAAAASASLMGRSGLALEGAGPLPANPLEALAGAQGPAGLTPAAAAGAGVTDTAALSTALALSAGLRPLVAVPQWMDSGEPAPAVSAEAAQQQALALAAGGVLPVLVGRGAGLTGSRLETGQTGQTGQTGVVLAAPTALAGSAALESGRISGLNWQINSPAASTPVTAVSALQEAQAQAASADLAEPLSEDLPQALRLRLIPSEFITQRLAAMAGTGEQATWGSVAGQSVATNLLRLDMRGLPLMNAAQATNGAVDPAVAEGQDLGLGEGAAPTSSTHLTHETGRASGPTSAAPAVPWSSTAAERAEQYEQLAQRLGEALGQRLQSQLERGQWKLQMRLDPAHLGRIDLDLDMSAGGLDAVFRSDNQMTRDLISQSLGRLRESLSQSGTAVANVWVQGDSSRQSGGNPTPGRTPEQPDGREGGRDAGSEDRISAAAAPRPRQGTSAWDVLA